MPSAATLTHRTPSRSGFTLVEISIVLVIIGLIVGGILVGADMIRAAELRAVTGEMNGVQTSVNAFRTKYNSLPGDMPTAERYWGFDAACPNTPTNETPKQVTCNGDGNGRIGNMNAAGTGAIDEYEWFRAWQQMANAGLYQGAYSGVAGALGASHCVLDVNCPRASVERAGYLLLYWGMSSTGNANFFYAPQAHWLWFGTPRPGVGGHTNNPAITASEAWALDQKMDDGLPGTGKVMSGRATSSFIPGCVVDPGGGAAEIYDADAEGVLCMLMFRVF